MKAGSGKRMKLAGIVLVGLLLAAVAGFGYITFLGPALQPADGRPSLLQSGRPYSSGNFSNHSNRKETAETVRERRTLVDQIVLELKKYYGKTIFQKSTQVKLLKVKKYLLKRFPEQGEKQFETALRRAFPKLADDILALLQKMERYEAWLIDNAEKLSKANKLEKEGLLWQARKKILGQDAEALWSEEVLAFERKKQEVRETIRFLDEADDMSMYDKLDEYQAVLQDVYQESSEAFVLENKGLLSRVFFSLHSVQAELKTKSPEDRRIEMANIRREIGFTQEQIERLEELDRYRDQRWENGLAYMQEREQLEQTYSGAEMENRLKELRKKYFKHEAKTIELEEKDHFFRYKRPRIYGRN